MCGFLVHYACVHSYAHFLFVCFVPAAYWLQSAEDWGVSLWIGAFFWKLKHCIYILALQAEAKIKTVEIKRVCILMCKLVVTLRRWCLVPQGGRNISLRVAKRFCCPVAFKVVEVVSGWEFAPDFSAGKQAESGGLAGHVIHSHSRLAPVNRKLYSCWAPAGFAASSCLFPCFCSSKDRLLSQIILLIPFWWPWPYVKVTAADKTQHQK